MLPAGDFMASYQSMKISLGLPMSILSLFGLLLMTISVFLVINQSLLAKVACQDMDQDGDLIMEDAFGSSNGLDLNEVAAES